MKISVDHPSIGKIVYDENFWSGKKSLTVNDIPAEKVSKNEFLINGEKAVIKGCNPFGVTLFYADQTIQISPKPKIYEYVLAILPILHFIHLFSFHIF